jgi:hypothetical protein
MLPKRRFSKTEKHFGPAVGNSQTCLFTNFPNISTTIRGSQFQGIREKAGLSETGVSCRRLFWTVVLSTFSSNRGQNLVLKPLKNSSKAQI